MLDPLIEIQPLSLLRLPYLLRDDLAKTSIDLNLNHLQVVVRKQILPIDHYVEVSLGEYAFAHIVVESFLSSLEWALRWPFVFLFPDMLDLLLAF